MSKVLIDRELLERAVYGLELAYETDTPTARDICAVLSAPSGTHAMPVKAYYHEAPNEYGGLNKSVGLEVRKQFTDAPLVLEADALARIACLEGEIAKRDEELAACRVAVENCELFRAELAAIKAQGPLTVEFMQFMTAVVTGAGLLSRGKQSKGLASELSATAYKYMLGAQVSGYQQKPIGYRCWFNKEPKNIMVEWGKSLPSDMNPSATYQELYAAPVSEAKAQGVVILDESKEAAEFESQFQGYKAFMRDSRASEAAGKYVCQRSHMFKVWMHFRAMLAAAPSAPAADAGLVDMYRHLQTVTPYRFKKIQDASVTDGGDVMYFHKDRFDAALLADMAAHCAAPATADSDVLECGE